jgi:hypothetical protein
VRAQVDDELAAADAALVAAYQRQPEDPLFVASARRLAAETAPPWDADVPSERPRKRRQPDPSTELHPKVR